MSDHDYRVAASQEVFRGRVLRVRSDQVQMPGDVVSQRDVAELPGAVGIVALDDDGRVLLVRQYRHPVARHLLEVPAGLLDSTTETALDAGQRELLEEGGLRARTWYTLVDVLTSPGMADETVRVLLARDLSVVAEDERPAPFHEEADMTTLWLPLEEAAERTLSGEIENSITVSALLAASRAAARGHTGLRPHDAPWPARKR